MAACPQCAHLHAVTSCQVGETSVGTVGPIAIQSEDRTLLRHACGVPKASICSGMLTHMGLLPMWVRAFAGGCLSQAYGRNTAFMLHLGVTISVECQWRVARGKPGVHYSRKHKSCNIVSPLLWLCVYLLVAQGPFPGLVLCFGNNGHVAVETSHNNRPGSSSQGHKGPCLDVLLFSTSADTYPSLTPFSQTPQGLMSALMSSCCPASPWVDVLPARFVSRPALAVHPPVTSLRTVILLI
jgi:hypothetical protein